MSSPLSCRPLGAVLKTASSAPATTTTTTTTTPRSSQRTNASADSASFPSSSSAPTTRVLANGTLSQGLWLDRSALAYDILVGQNFVVHRPRRGGPGLVPSPRPPAFATRTARPAAGPEGGVPSRFTRPRSGPPARRGSGGGGAGSSSVAASSPRFLLSAAGGDAECSAAAAFFDVTEYSVVESSSSSSSSTALSASASFSASSPRVFILGTSGGLAAPNSSSSSPSFSPSQNGNNPRRTRRLAWTCNLCGGRKVSPVNPLAWEKGSVFVRCARCDVVHKVKDNLKIFHELAGQVYPTGNKAGSATLPPEAAAAAEAALRKWNQGN